VWIAIPSGAIATMGWMAGITWLTLPMSEDPRRSGIGAPSHAAEAMEMGADAILVNTALADAWDRAAMAKAFALAVTAGRLACWPARS
jgi:thiazole synthase ThiGH ThiG subunit